MNSEKLKKVAFLIKNPKKRYSGGRIYSLTLAKAFYYINWDVTIFTNNKPIFFEELIADANIKIFENKYFNFKIREADFDLFIIVPHLATLRNFIFDKIFYYSRIKKFNSNNIWFIDFESPLWIKELIPKLRSQFSYINSNYILKNVNAIVSISKTGMKYAEKSYVQINKNLNYEFLYPPINDGVAKKYYGLKKKNQISIFARFGNKHKDPFFIFKLIRTIPKNYYLNIITNIQTDSNIYRKIVAYAKDSNTNINIHINVNEEKKFKILSLSKTLVFKSDFEGYGLPPLEAQYFNTNVICSDLEVLRELNPKALFIKNKSESELKNLINKSIKSKIKIHKFVNDIASFDVFCKNLQKILIKYNLT